MAEPPSLSSPESEDEKGDPLSKAFGDKDTAKPDVLRSLSSESDSDTDIESFRSLFSVFKPGHVPGTGLSTETKLDNTGKYVSLVDTADLSVDRGDERKVKTETVNDKDNMKETEQDIGFHPSYSYEQPNQEHNSAKDSQHTETCEVVQSTTDPPGHTKMTSPPKSIVTEGENRKLIIDSREEVENKIRTITANEDACHKTQAGEDISETDLKSYIGDKIGPVNQSDVADDLYGAIGIQGNGNRVTEEIKDTSASMQQPNDEIVIDHGENDNFMISRRDVIITKSMFADVPYQDDDDDDFQTSLIGIENIEVLKTTGEEEEEENTFSTLTDVIITDSMVADVPYYNSDDDIYQTSLIGIESFEVLEKSDDADKEDEERNISTSLSDDKDDEMIYNKKENLNSDKLLFDQFEKPTIQSASTAVESCTKLEETSMERNKDKVTETSRTYTSLLDASFVVIGKGSFNDSKHVYKSLSSRKGNDNRDNYNSDKLEVFEESTRGKSKQKTGIHGGEVKSVVGIAQVKMENYREDSNDIQAERFTEKGRVKMAESFHENVQNISEQETTPNRITEDVAESEVSQTQQMLKANEVLARSSQLQALEEVVVTESETAQTSLTQYDDQTLEKSSSYCAGRQKEQQKVHTGDTGSSTEKVMKERQDDPEVNQRPKQLAPPVPKPHTGRNRVPLKDTGISQPRNCLGAQVKSKGSTSIQKPKQKTTKEGPQPRSHLINEEILTVAKEVVVC